MEKGLIVVLTSTASEESARHIAASVVEAKLAACVQISAPGLSIYTWNDVTQQEQEYYLSIKTTESACHSLIDWLRDNHPYDTPEIIRIEGSASSAYMLWLQQSVQ